MNSILIRVAAVIIVIEIVGKTAEVDSGLLLVKFKSMVRQVVGRVWAMVRMEALRRMYVHC